MKKLVVLAVFGLALGIANMVFAKTLVDVPEKHWAADAVQKLVDMGLIEGYPDGTFKGDRPMTRYEYAMIVERMMTLIDATYCKKADCKGGETIVKEPTVMEGITEAQLEEVKAIVKKLAAEFKDELAALKVKVDENSARIDKLEKDVATARIGNVSVSGSIRQRVDVANTDLMTNGTFPDLYTHFLTPMYGMAADAGVAANGLNVGYEMLPHIQLNGAAGKDVDFAVALEKSIRTSPIGWDTANEENSELAIEYAYVDVNLTPTVRELDALKIRSGYQNYAFGPYGMLVDNAGVGSNPAVKLDVAKDIVSLTGIGGLAGITGIGVGDTQGIGAAGKDPYAAVRLGLDLPWLDVGVNFLANGIDQEKGWGADITAPLLSDSPFLKELRAEFITITDLTDGTDVGSTLDENSFIVGLDLYKSKRAGLTLSYADLPAAAALSSLDANPFTEYDDVCSAGLDVGPVTGSCINKESERTLFPAGFEGLGVEASYIVFGDVELAGKAVLGNFAGGSVAGLSDGDDYPGFGALSVTKPINDKSKLRVEYMQQGKDPILLNRVRGELLINF